MGWLVVWCVVGLLGAWLRWVFAEPLVVRLLADSEAVGGGPAAFDSIERLGRFVEGAGLVMIVSAAFMVVVQVRATSRARVQEKEVG